MLRSDQYSAIIQVLREVRERPHAFLGHLQPILFNIFLEGFGLACRFMVDRDGLHGVNRARIEQRRGWDTTQAHVLDCLKAAGLGDDEMIGELLTIEIETRQWELATDANGDKPAATEPAIIEDILTFYNYALSQPSLLTGTEMVVPLTILLSGFHLVRAGLGVAEDFPWFFQHVIESRKIDPEIGVVESLYARGLDEVSIHKEVIAIERQSWQLKYASLIKNRD